MTITKLRDICLSFPGTSYDFPFDTETMVFRVGRKMFALTNINKDPVAVNLKCDPELARDLRAAFTSVSAGYHMNKEHWNTVTCGGDVSDERLEWLIAHSYERVVAGLPKGGRPNG